MPTARSQQFGDLQYDESEAITFPSGLPAFESERNFVLVTTPSTKPLVFLQSLERPDLCFVTLPLLTVDPGYQLSVSAEDLRVLGLTEVFSPSRQPQIGPEITCLAIMSLTDSRPTANLLAPVVIGNSSRKAVQAIRADSLYSHETVLEGLCS